MADLDPIDRWYSEPLNDQIIYQFGVDILSSLFPVFSTKS